MRSMTGFGRATFRVDGTSFDVEARSVNHRYLDVRVRVPKLLANAEATVRERIAAHFARGKIDVVVSAPNEGGPPPRLEVDLEAASEYARAATRLAESPGFPGSLDLATVLGLPGVVRFAESELEPDALAREALVAVDQALEALDAMRATEGDALERDLSSRLGHVSALADALEERAGEVAQLVRDRLRKRAEQLARETGHYDEARLHQEIVIAADRMDVTEEIVRLRSHLDQFRSISESAGPGSPVGRRLDFLLQEMSREANTIGSKGSDAPIAHSVVELKAEIERLREQVQNVE
jgi:uncharacterized protein (TIGR00255 family)